MDDLGDDDISDTQFNEICENVLTQRELREFSMEWSETENDCMQGDSFSQSNKPERKRK